MQTFVLLRANCPTVTSCCAFWWSVLGKTFGSCYSNWRFKFMLTRSCLEPGKSNPRLCSTFLTPILILSTSLVSIIWRAALILKLYSTAFSTCPFFIRRSNQALMSPIVVLSRGCALLCYMPNGQIVRHTHLRPHRENCISVIKKTFIRPQPAPHSEHASLSTSILPMKSLDWRHW